MKLKPVITYQLNDSKKALIVYYGIVIFVFFALAIGNQLIFGMRTSMNFALETTTMVFAFVVGLNFFKENFYIMLQNGISRKTLFLGTIISILFLSFGMAVVDNVLTLLLKLVDNIGTKGMQVNTIFETFYPGVSQSMGAWLTTLVNILFLGVLYTMLISLGYFISLGYYKMNKIATLSVSIGVPVFFFVVLPIFVGTFVGFSLIDEIFYFIATILGIQSGLPILGFIVFIGIFVAFSGLNYLMLRKAVVKS